MTVTPIRPGVEPRKEDEFHEWFGQKLNEYREHHGVEASAVVVVMFNPEGGIADEGCDTCGGGMPWGRYHCIRNGKAMVPAMSYGTSAAILLKP